MSTEVRVGDRYVHGDERMTVTGIDKASGIVEYTAMRGEGRDAATWHARTRLTGPGYWTKVGSGPKVVVLCLFCETEDVEPGMLFCLGCADDVVVQWAGLSAEEMEDRVEAMKLARDAADDFEERT